MSSYMIWVLLAVVSAFSVLLFVIVRRLLSTRDRLARMESRFATTLEGSEAGLAVWDSAGRLVACNQRFREFYPTVQLKPGLIFEEFARVTATCGLVQLSESEVDKWVEERVRRFGRIGHDVVRAADRRWLEIDTRPTGSGEILLLYTDATRRRETEAKQFDCVRRMERQSADLALLADVIQVGSVATSLESASAEVVALVCRWAGWPVGYAYLVSGEDKSLTVEPLWVWHVEADAEDRFAELRQVTERHHPQRGQDIVARALQTGRLVWIPNVAVDLAIASDQRAAMKGLQGACAVPVKHHDEVVVVLQFFGRDQLLPDPATTWLLEAISEILGWSFRTCLDA